MQILSLRGSYRIRSDIGEAMSSSDAFHQAMLLSAPEPVCSQSYWRGADIRLSQRICFQTSARSVVVMWTSLKILPIHFQKNLMLCAALK
jgi:hypothetical protein